MVFNIERFGGNGSHWVVGGEFLLGHLADGASGSEKGGSCSCVGVECLFYSLAERGLSSIPEEHLSEIKENCVPCHFSILTVFFVVVKKPTLAIRSRCH